MIFLEFICCFLLYQIVVRRPFGGLRSQETSGVWTPLVFWKIKATYTIGVVVVVMTIWFNKISGMARGLNDRCYTFIAVPPALRGYRHPFVLSQVEVNQIVCSINFEIEWHE